MNKNAHNFRQGHEKVWFYIDILIRNAEGLCVSITKRYNIEVFNSAI